MVIGWLYVNLVSRINHLTNTGSGRENAGSTAVSVMVLFKSTSWDE